MRKRLFLIIILLSAAASVFSENIVSLSSVLNEKTRSGKITATFSIPEGLHQLKQDDYFNFTVTAPEGFHIGEIVYPDPVIILGEPSYDGNVTLSRDFTWDNNVSPGDYLFTVNTVYQFCNDQGTCFFPVKETRDIGFSLTSTAPPAVGKTAGTVLLYLLMALLGGIILNFMPCVLPVLSIKALNIVKQSGNNRGEIFRKSLSYTAGIVVSFWILAALVIILQSSGKILGWGFQFQNYRFVLFLAWIVFAFGLSLFDLFTVQPPALAGKGTVKASATGGIAGSFFTGIFAVLLATPCTAPFLGVAMGFAFSQPPLVIILFFTATGIGLALPFIILGIRPGIIKKIPKPGPWMDTFKTVLGFMLMATALYLLKTLYLQIGEGFFSVLWFFLFSALGLWIWGKGNRPDRKRSIRILSISAAAVIIVVSGLLFLRNINASSETKKTEIDVSDDSIRFSVSQLDEYRNSGFPVFVKFTADWCLTCKANETAVLNTGPVREMFEKYGIKELTGDLTEENDELLEFIQGFGRAGVPFYLLYRPGEAEPVVFPEIINRQILEKEFEKLETGL